MYIYIYTHNIVDSIITGTLKWGCDRDIFTDDIFDSVRILDESGSDPDSKQKTEWELTFWYVLPDFIHSEPFPWK